MCYFFAITKEEEIFYNHLNDKNALFYKYVLRDISLFKINVHEMLYQTDEILDKNQSNIKYDILVVGFQYIT